MSEQDVDLRRRRFLTGAAIVVGSVGVVAAMVPFVSSLRPSAKAQAAGAPVEVDIGKLAPGQMITVEWRGKPVYILRRTEANLASLKALEGNLRDPASEVPQQPDYARNEYRSLKPEIFVAIGICTHLGCAPTYRPEVAPADLGAEWKGGFFCPCHGSRFDLAGRVYKGVPAPTNLEVPPYTFLSDTLLLIGSHGEGKA
ncbi:MAG: ubiquinol-cytochrome c reductase iron-sulfur subunit [Gammaproteobacteria bacterium]|nr:ubiquinol-cytochrome c reductase iron-sulfur subunit [Gammaproteobacteria bacterium]